jgi:aminoacyl tRNA synthase complex-interacting multifunctional protein 1
VVLAYYQTDAGSKERTMASALDLIDAAIADLEAKLHLASGGSFSVAKTKEEKPKRQPKTQGKKPAAKNENLPDICKLEFIVGKIVKVWDHPDAEKLYCEEINVGEDAPRQIASGLRPHFTEEAMLGRRVLVVNNLKARNLVGFKSHGMVLCAALTREDGSELVEFVEPPEGAHLGEVVSFEGLPAPEPWSAAQVEKNKVFAACMEGMKTTDDCLAAWNGHVFMTSAGPCKCATIKGGVLR